MPKPRENLYNIFIITTASLSLVQWHLNYVQGQILDWSVSGKNFSQWSLQKVNIYLLHTLLKNSAWSFMKQVYKFNMDPNAHRLQEWPSHSSKIQQLKEIKIITCLSRPSVHGLYVFSVMERSKYFLSPTGTE